MATTTKDYVISDLKVYVAPVGTARPTASVAYGTPWSSPWVELGDQKEGAKISYTFEKFQVTTQRTRGAVVAERRHSERAMAELVLAQFNKNALIYSLPADLISSTAPTSTANGLDVLGVGGKGCLPTLAWGFEGQILDDECEESYFIRFFFHKGTVDGGFEAAFSFDDFVGIPLKVSAIADPALPVGQQLMRVELEVPATGD